MPAGGIEVAQKLDVQFKILNWRYWRRKSVAVTIYSLKVENINPDLPLNLRRKPSLRLLSALLFLIAGLCQSVSAQHSNDIGMISATPVAAEADLFRLEITKVPAGAELITIHARWEGLNSTTNDKWIPVVSVLRDTLGDRDPENDRLRYVWPLTYTNPSFRQKLSGAIPFLYMRVGNKDGVSSRPPPPALDLAAADREVWQKIFWTALQNILLDPYGIPVKASTRSYQRNVADYRKSQIVRALAVLALYQSMQQDKEQALVFSDSEMAAIQARLLLTDKTFGGLLDELNLQRYFNKDLVSTRDARGHNWDLLRQRAEAESLYFEPLEMPDGSVTHALLWVAKSDVTGKRDQRFNSRFLNIAKPWGDKRLLNWKGFEEIRYFDADSRPVNSDTPGAQPVEMIPLALYGLDNPKIPMLLVDFRDSLNPKKREMSRRLLQDVTRNVVSLSKFGDVSYFLGRTVFDFVTSRRGIDFNQPSRLRTYSQLKLLLALNDSLDPELRTEIGKRLENVSLNPMGNDLETEAKLARQQFAALISYAEQPDGLSARLDKDRRTEMVKLEHGRTEQVFFRLANVLTFGRYVHREKADPQMEARLDVSRRLAYHTNFLREVSRSSPQIDVKWNLEDVRRSLHYISLHGSEAKSGAISATVKIFVRTRDDDTRRACLESLSKISNPKAREQLIRISQSKELDQAGRDLLIAYLEDPDRQLDPFTTSFKSSGERVEQR